MDVSRRRFLRTTWLASGVAVLATAGGTVAFLRPVSPLSTRSDCGPQGVPVNRTARAAGIVVPDDWRLEVRSPSGSGPSPDSRTLLAIAGAAALAWGGYLVAEFALAPDAWQAALWFLGGPLVHDAVVAPIVGAIGLLIATRLPAHWRTPVTAGVVATGVLVVLAVPLLWGPLGVPENPGLHDRDYGLGLAAALCVVWLLAVVAGLITSRRTRESPAEPPEA